MKETTEESEFTGIWRRESLSIANGKPFENSEAYWLQAGDVFADMRWPTNNNESAMSAFAGHTLWTQPTMRFIHKIDFTKEFLEDKTNITKAGSKLKEEGEVTLDGEVIKFSEIWAPLHSPLEPMEIYTAHTNCTSAETGYLVRVNDFAIAMHEEAEKFSAACWRQVDSEWRLLKSIGKTEHLRVLLAKTSSGLSYKDWKITARKFSHEL